MQAGHNRLRSFVERVERIRDEIAALNADVSEVYKEAKNEGWDVKAMKVVIAERQRAAKDPAKFQELNALIELYRTALESGTDNATRVRAHEMTNSLCAAAVPTREPVQQSGGAESPPAPTLTHFADYGRSATPRGDCGRPTEEKESDDAVASSAGVSRVHIPVKSSQPAAQFNSAGDMTDAGKEGEGNGAHTPPRIPEPVSEMISTQSARSGDLHAEDDLALPAFLDRRGHGR